MAVTDTDSTDSARVRIEKHEQTLVQVVENNDFLKELAAPTIADFRQHQATDSCGRKPHRA